LLYLYRTFRNSATNLQLEMFNQTNSIDWENPVPTVRTTRTINASSSKIWTVLSDFSNIQIFHPNVLDVDQLSEVDRGLGAERRCNFYSGGSVVEKIISWDDERQFFTCTVTEISAPILDVTAGMGVKLIDSHHSEVQIEMTYVPKWGIFGKILDVLMLRMGMRHVFNKVLKGLQHHVETGELIGKNGRPISHSSQTKTTQLQQG